MDKIHTAIILDTRRKKKSNTYPVKIRLTYLRKQYYFGIGHDLTKDELKRVMVKNPKGGDKNLFNKFKAELDRADKILEGMPAFEPVTFKKRFTNRYDPFDLFLAFRNHIDELHAAGKISTASTYETALKSFGDFAGNGKKLTFDQVTPAFLKRYEDSLIRKGRSITTVSINTRCLRRLFNKYIKEGQIKQEIYPFVRYHEEQEFKYSVPEHVNVKKALSKADLKKIFDYIPEEYPEDFCRDIWLFSYLCNGANMADILRLKWQNIDGDTITFVRQKTRHIRRTNDIQVEIDEHSQAIIDRWGQKAKRPGQYIINVLRPGLTPEKELALIKQQTKQVNKYIGRIGQKVGIASKVTTYTARHSFATVLDHAGVPVSYISQQLGHSDIKTTKNYLKSLDKKKARAVQKVLTHFDED